MPGKTSEFDVNNPLHPWKQEGKIWLTDLLFQKGNISRATADKFLVEFANGTLTTADGPVQFQNSREMLKLLDIAAENTVVSSKTVSMFTV